MSKIVPLLKKSPLVKVAYKTKEHEVDFAKQDFNDGYFCKVQLTENKNQTIVTARVLSDIRSFPLFQDIWVYGNNENKRAIKTFNRIVNVLEDTKIDFEEDETPGPTLQGVIREELRYIDIERKRDTHNRSLEAAKYLDGVTDWRESLYGNRYPVININNSNGVVNFNELHGKQT